MYPVSTRYMVRNIYYILVPIGMYLLRTLKQLFIQYFHACIMYFYLDFSTTWFSVSWIKFQTSFSFCCLLRSSVSRSEGLRRAISSSLCSSSLRCSRTRFSSGFSSSSRPLSSQSGLQLRLRTQTRRVHPASVSDWHKTRHTQRLTNRLWLSSSSRCRFW